MGAGGPHAAADGAARRPDAARARNQFQQIWCALDRPAHGWPVAIFGHFLTGNKDDSPYRVASTLAAHGIATVAINAVGHGFGPLGVLTVHRQDQPPVRLPAGGRGIDQNGDGLIDTFEGFEAAPPRRIIGGRDGSRQTVVDLMQLVRVIQVGVDVDLDGHPDLDPSRIYYFGQSSGGKYWDGPPRGRAARARRRPQRAGWILDRSATDQRFPPTC